MIDRKTGWGRKGKSAARAYLGAAPHPHRIGPPEALLGPGIPAHVVAVLLPEAGVVLRQNLEPSHPLRALPEIEVRHQQPNGAAVFRRQRLAVVGEREQVIGAVEIFQGQVGREPMLGVDQREAAFGADTGAA